MTGSITNYKISRMFTDSTQMGATLAQLHMRELIQLNGSMQIPCLGLRLPTCRRHCVATGRGNTKHSVTFHYLHTTNWSEARVHTIHDCEPICQSWNVRITYLNLHFGVWRQCRCCLSWNVHLNLCFWPGFACLQACPTKQTHSSFTNLGHSSNAIHLIDILLSWTS